MNDKTTHIRRAPSRNARLTPALMDHAEEVLAQLLRYEYPADAVVSRYFRENRNLGHADRAFVAEAVFAVLRRQRSLEARVGCADPRQLLLAALVCVRGFNARELEHILRGKESEELGRYKAIKEDELPPAVRCDLPDWLYERLLTQMDAEAILSLSRSLNQSAPLDLRVNPMKMKRDALVDALNETGITAQAGEYSPLAVRLQGKPPLSKNPLFMDGSFEVQDEGSQLLGFLLAPKRGEGVADFCAGAGGKTLLLGALMKNTGRLYAFDVSDKRLANLRPRLARSGLSNVHPGRIEHERDQKVRRMAGKLDRVLVDAPCSGLGTLRRNPDLKWRQSPESVAELTQKQAAILDAAATLVKPGGRLVYATCSLLAEENEGIVQAFLAQHPDFTLVPAAEILKSQGVGGLEDKLAPALTSGMLHLLPNQQGTDGFFAAALERQR
jgi:16S rRNA (cytosine967-C5)-methyltransferase